MLIYLLRVFHAGSLLFALTLSLTSAGCHLVPNPKVLTRPIPAKTPPATSGKEESVRRDVVAYARQYEGKPYKAGGKAPGTGFDCSGFTSYVMKKFNVALSASAADQIKQGRERSIQAARPGDLVFFRRGPDLPVFHVAMVVSNTGKNLKVIHSSSSRGVVVDDIMQSTYWKPKIDAARTVLP